MMKMKMVKFFVPMLLSCALFENINASLDTTFNPSGTPPGTVVTVFSYSVPEPYSHASGVAIQNDQKIVAAGTTIPTAGSGEFTLARYNTDGSLDTPFGNGGQVIIQTPFVLNSTRAVAQAVAIDNSGNIVVAGYAFVQPPHQTGAYQFAVARYNTDGEVDFTVTTRFNNSTVSEANALVIQGDTIVVGGYTTVSGTQRFALARYTSDGELDTTFGGNNGDRAGTVTTVVGNNGSTVQAVVLQGDNIVAIGAAGNLGSAGSSFALARYTADGVIDDSFGSDGTGTVITSLPGIGNGASSAAVQSDGSIVVLGNYVNDSVGNVGVLARYTPNGILDPTFADGQNGGLYLAASPDDMGYSAVALDAQQHIVTAGNHPGDFVVARFTPNGIPDGFNVTTSFSGPGAYAVAIQSDDKVVLAGATTQQFTSNNFTLARYVPPIITGRLSALTIAIQNKYG